MNGEQQYADMEYHRRVLEGERLPVSERDPQVGFYKRRASGEKDGPWLPILFKRDKQSGKIVCGFQGSLVDPLEHWTWAARFPVSKPDYLFYMENGHWRGDTPPSDLSNLPTDPEERVKAELLGKEELIKEFLKKFARIDKQEDCDRASNIVAPVSGLLKEADNLRKQLKKPHDDAADAVQERFKYCKPIETLAKKIKELTSDFATRESNRLKAEALKKQREEQAKLDAERKALEASDPILAEITPREVAKVEEPIKLQAGGLTGRKQGFKTVYDIEVTDADSLLQSLKDNSEVKDKAIEVARRMVKKFGFDVPMKLEGIEIIERKCAA